MTEIVNFEHNGLTVNKISTAVPMGALSDDVIALVGPSPDADAAIFPINQPVRISTMTEAAKLDTLDSGKGFLVHAALKTLEQAQVPIYIIRTAEDVDGAVELANVIGGANAGTGQKEGIQAIHNCLEKPTLIAAPGYSHELGVAQALALVGQKVMARSVISGNAIKSADVVTWATSLGNETTGFDSVYVVGHTARYTGQKGTVTMPGEVVALGRIAANKPWIGPGHQGVAIDGVDVQFDYNALDKTTEGELLNKNGVSYFATTSAGGWSLIGNRTLTGRFLAHVGLEHQLSRKLILAMEKQKGGSLTKTFMEQEVEKVNNWLEGLIASEIVMPGSRCYLHPEKNTTASYTAGTWFIVVEYAAFGVNEHTIIELTESDVIVVNFLDGVLN